MDYLLLRSFTLAMHEPPHDKTLENHITFPKESTLNSSRRGVPIAKSQKIPSCQHVNIVVSIVNALNIRYSISNALKHLTDQDLSQNWVGLDRKNWQTNIYGLCCTRHLGDWWSKFWSPSRKNGCKCDWASANFTPWVPYLAPFPFHFLAGTLLSQSR